MELRPQVGELLEFVVLVPLSHIAWFVKTCVSLVLHIETPCKLLYVQEIKSSLSVAVDVGTYIMC